MARLFWWPFLGLVGVASGLMLGEVVTGGQMRGFSGEGPSFARLSANPDALVAQGKTAPPCLDCADSYGVATRLRARYDNPGDNPGYDLGDDQAINAFRELGRVDVDPPVADDPDDDYRYGGRFDVPESRLRRAAATSDSTPGSTTAADDVVSDD